MTELRFDDRVVVITGAGNGLGRSHALYFASRGAKVVVNDLGGGRHGDEDGSSAAADQVVSEIKKAGGDAVANYDSVENGEAIIKTALDNYGRVDVVVNNAGILRDISFSKMKDEDWDLIQRVHLNGTKSVTKAAWDLMREQGYGRIVMTTSAAGLYGNFGQANYCSAKLGILGLAQCLAIEGESKNIHVNTIAPVAASRLTETVMPPELLANLKPEAVSPLVAWLCHEECKENKGVFEVGAGFISKLRWERTTPKGFAPDKPFTIDDVRDQWSQITDFHNSENPANITESVSTVIEHINNPPLGGNQFVDLDEANGVEVELASDYNERDVALYALGIGAARDPLNENDLKYVYELNPGFSVFPTWGAMPMLNAMLAGAKAGTLKLPGCNFGFDKLLHGEQYTEIKRPLLPNASLTHKFSLKKALDKNPNAVVTFGITSLDEDGDEVAYNEFTAFVKDAGGWGGDRGSDEELITIPDREPDAVVEEKTDDNQTLLYRLSGDWNPLHADPAFAKAFGYEKPILHGMCTFGHVARHVINEFVDGEGGLFKSIKVRFAKSVYPGDTLITKMWKEEGNRILIETTAKERNEVVIKNAYVDLYSDIPGPKPNKTDVSSECQAPDELLREGLHPGVAMLAINNFLKDNPDIVEAAGAVIQVNLQDPNSQWVIDIKNDGGSTYEGSVEKPDVTMTSSEEAFMKVCKGEEDAQKLFFAGKLKLDGNMMVAQKLDFLRSIDQMYFENALTEFADPSVSTAADRSSVAFAAISDYLSDNPEVVEASSAIVQICLNDPVSQWVIDIKNPGKGAYRGEAEKPDVTMTASEEDFMGVCEGFEDAQQLFFAGKLKLDGNMLVAQKLDFLRSIDKSYFDNAKLCPRGDDSTPSAVVDSREPQAQHAFEVLKTLDASELVNGVANYKISEPDSEWTVTVFDSSIVVKEGVSNDADCVVTMSDETLEEIMKGSDAKSLFQNGKISIDGDIRIAKQIEYIKLVDI